MLRLIILLTENGYLLEKFTLKTDRSQKRMLVLNLKEKSGQQLEW